VTGHDDSQFSTELTKVTFDGIVAVLQCRSCREIFVPETQRLGIVDCERLREAVQQDVQDGDNLDERSLVGIRLIVERMNAERRGGVH
jgi:predicted metal-binding protein